MITFQYDKFDSINDELEKLGETTDDIKRQLYEAAVPVVADEWQEQLKSNIMPRGTVRHSLRNTNKKYKYITKSTGETTESVGGNIKQDFADIYPRGKDHKGVRNAEKAFILNYGRKNMIAKDFIETIDKNSDEKVQKAMENKLDEILRKKGLI